MFEKVNPSHPDKIADRIAGALVDMAYGRQERPRIAVEVLIGHGQCWIVAETSASLDRSEVKAAVRRIAGKDVLVSYNEYNQDNKLAQNQSDGIRCGDNGIFKGVPVTEEQRELSELAHRMYAKYPYDGKYILDKERNRCVICQSYMQGEQSFGGYDVDTNPIGFWTGGTDVDTGATNRKLGSDMGDSVTGGGLHGKDLSKADVSVNVYAWLKAQETGEAVELSCAIGDSEIDGKPYGEIVRIAGEYIAEQGGFERFAEWGLV